MTESAPIAIEVGQVWADDDPRSQGRTIRITEVDPPNFRARAVIVTVARNVGEDQVGRRTRWISFRRFRPGKRGYRLLENPVTGTRVEG